MGGALQYRSALGEGSTFWFEVPLAPCAAAPAAAVRPRRADASEKRPCILVADDHPTNRRVVELMLTDEADLVCVENGQEAVDAFAAGDFDLILMDMQMPVMDGLTAVRRIRQLERPGNHVPMIMLTANALPEHVQASAAAGADLHLEKPITAAALFAAIDTVFDAALSAQMHRPVRGRV